MDRPKKPSMRHLFDAYFAPSTSSEEPSQRLQGKHFALIRNIPRSYHSKNLRIFFADYVENGRFDCFHFKHRPEIQDKNAETSSSTFCCVVRFASEDDRASFVADYNGLNWTDEASGLHLPRKCFVTAVKLSDGQAAGSANLSASDLLEMIELRPPEAMPNGNVGTPTAYFLSQISQCKLPPSLITRLGLKRQRRKRKFEAVDFVYNGSRPLTYGYKKVDASDDNDRRKTMENEASRVQGIQEEAGDDEDPTDVAVRQIGPDNDDAPAKDDDDQCEEWERHEAHYNDVTEQDRTKEKKFEQEMEVVWEKGGPGLVWNMDKEYWDEREKGTDCDWMWADDWDVDYSVYYEGKMAGDKDARDCVEIRDDEARRKGGPAESVFRKRKGPAQGGRQRRHSGSDVVDFEKGSKRIGSTLMRKMGWTPGTGLGMKGREGRVNPVALQMEDDALVGRERPGLGYRGEALNRNVTKPPVRHAIVSVYDEYTDKDQQRDSLRRVGDDPTDATKEILWRQKEPTYTKHT
ncbi:unnamed protein product, partial [Mesorhabditis spiculigera]